MAAFNQHIEDGNVMCKSTTDAGNGLFATRQIKLKNTILSVNQPLMLALDTPRLKDTCYCCLTYMDKSGQIRHGDESQTKALKACTGCHTVRYCDKDCQKSSWNDYHRFECKVFAKLEPKVLPNNVRAVVRLLLMQNLKRLPQGEWDQLIALEAHSEKLRRAGDETWQNLCLMTKAAKEYSGSTLDESTILGLFCRLMVNSFTLVTPTYDPIGLFLHPLPATLNHSCDYNAVIRISKRVYHQRLHAKIEVIPLRQIEKGEEVLISYIDDNLPYLNRQRELQERYFFTCQCRKCLQGPTAPTDIFFDGPAPLDLQEVKKLEDRTTELLKSAESDTGLTGPVQKLKYALYLINETRIWPIHRYPFPALRHQLILAYLDARQFNLAFSHATIQHFKVDPILMPVSHHPIRMVHDWIFVLLMDHIMNPEKNEWAAQKLDLVSYKIDINFWRSYIIRELYRAKEKLPFSDFTAMIHNKHCEIRFSRYYGLIDETTLESKEKYDKEIELMEKMMDDVLEADGAWQIAT